MSRPRAGYHPILAHQVRRTPGLSPQLSRLRRTMEIPDEIGHKLQTPPHRPTARPPKIEQPGSPHSKKRTPHPPALQALNERQLHESTAFRDRLSHFGNLAVSPSPRANPASAGSSPSSHAHPTLRRHPPFPSPTPPAILLRHP
jgi:hypothetical protein